MLTDTVSVVRNGEWSHFTSIRHKVLVPWRPVFTRRGKHSHLIINWLLQRVKKRLAGYYGKLLIISYGRFTILPCNLKKVSARDWKLRCVILVQLSVRWKVIGEYWSCLSCLYKDGWLTSNSGGISTISICGNRPSLISLSVRLPILVILVALT